jgi:hypothetical protein
MPSKSETPDKDGLGRFHQFSQALIPWVALLFTVVFGWLELKNQAATRLLTTSNIKLARAQVKVSLIQLLTSKDPSKRAMGLNLLEQLSPAGLKKLDQRLLSAANRDEKEGNLDQAARKYRAPFRFFILSSGVGTRQNDGMMDLSKIIAYELNLVSKKNDHPKGVILVNSLRAY